MPERIAVDGCMVVNRVELEAAVDAAIKGADAVGMRQGMVMGLMAAAGVAGAGWLIGATGLAELLLVLFTCALLTALVYRVWDASGATFTLGWWSVADFAVHLKDQWDREASEEHGG